MHENDDGASSWWNVHRPEHNYNGHDNGQSKTSAPGGHAQVDSTQDGHAAWHSLLANSFDLA